MTPTPLYLPREPKEKFYAKCGGKIPNVVMRSLVALFNAGKINIDKEYLKQLQDTNLNRSEAMRANRLKRWPIDK